MGPPTFEHATPSVRTIKKGPRGTVTSIQGSVTSMVNRIRNIGSSAQNIQDDRGYGQSPMKNLIERPLANSRTANEDIEGHMEGNFPLISPFDGRARNQQQSLSVKQLARDDRTEQPRQSMRSALNQQQMSGDESTTQFKINQKWQSESQFEFAETEVVGGKSPMLVKSKYDADNSITVHGYNYRNEKTEGDESEMVFDSVTQKVPSHAQTIVSDFPVPVSITDAAGSNHGAIEASRQSTLIDEQSQIKSVWPTPARRRYLNSQYDIQVMELSIDQTCLIRNQNFALESSQFESQAKTTQQNLQAYNNSVFESNGTEAVGTEQAASYSGAIGLLHSSQNIEVGAFEEVKSAAKPIDNNLTFEESQPMTSELEQDSFAMQDVSAREYIPKISVVIEDFFTENQESAVPSEKAAEAFLLELDNSKLSESVKDIVEAEPAASEPQLELYDEQNGSETQIDVQPVEPPSVSSQPITLSEEFNYQDLTPRDYIQAELDFKKLDKNKDGKLDHNEIRRHLQKFGGQNMYDREATLSHFFETSDANGDGKIDFAEWLVLYQQMIQRNDFQQQMPSQDPIVLEQEVLEPNVNDFQQQMPSQGPTVREESIPELSITEEQEEINQQEANFDNSHPISCTTRHNRDVQSFQVIPQNNSMMEQSRKADRSRQEEAGVEQYESDDGMDRLDYSSLQNTSQTNLGPVTAYGPINPVINGGEESSEIQTGPVAVQRRSVPQSVHEDTPDTRTGALASLNGPSGVQSSEVQSVVGESVATRADPQVPHGITMPQSHLNTVMTTEVDTVVFRESKPETSARTSLLVAPVEQQPSQETDIFQNSLEVRSQEFADKEVVEVSDHDPVEDQVPEPAHEEAHEEDHEEAHDEDHEEAHDEIVVQVNDDNLRTWTDQGGRKDSPPDQSPPEPELVMKESQSRSTARYTVTNSNEMHVVDISIEPEEQVTIQMTDRGITTDPMIIDQEENDLPAKRKKVRSHEKKSKSKGSKKSTSGSRSPERRLVIQNGKVVAKDYEFEKRRKSKNVKSSQAERKSLKQDRFQDSNSMIQRMKNRINKYNHEMAPYAVQQRYQQDLLQSHTGVNMSLQVQNSAEPTSHRSKYEITPAGTDIEKIIIFDEQQNTKVPVFLRNMSRPRNGVATEQTLGDDQINNIQIDNKGNFDIKRLSNSQNLLPGYESTVLHGSQESNRDRASRENLLSEFTDRQIQQRSLERKSIESQQNVRHKSDIRILDNKLKPKTQQKQRDRKSGLNVRNNPSSASEIKYKTKKQSRRLIVIDPSNARQNITAAAGVGSQPFYPQDAHAKSSLPDSGLSKKQILRANLASRFAQNTVQAKQAVKKNNQLVGKVQNKSHARNQGVDVVLAAGGDPNSSQYASNRQNLAQIAHQMSSERKQQQMYLDDARQTRKNSYDGNQGALLLPIRDGRAAQNKSQDNLGKMKHMFYNRKPISIQPSDRVGVQTQESAEFQRPDNHKSAHDKFQRWLEKGKPGRSYHTQGNQSREDRRNLGIVMRNSARVNENTIAASLAEVDHGYTSTEDADPAYKKDQKESLYTAQPFDGSKVNLQLALKFLNDPKYGMTVEQRKANLRIYLEQNHPEELRLLTQPSENTNEDQVLFCSIEDQRFLRSMIQSRYAVEKQKDKIGQQVEIENAQRALFQAQFGQLKSLSQVTLNQLRMGQFQNPQRQSLQQPQILHEGPVNNDRSKLNSITQIYSQNNKKRRAIHLKNNYAKSGNFMQAQKPRRSISQEKDMNHKDKKGEQYFNKRSTNNSSIRHGQLKPVSSTNTVTPGSNSFRQLNDVASSSTKVTQGSKFNHQRSRPDPFKLSKVRNIVGQNISDQIQHDDSLLHPQINLNMPQGEMSDRQDSNTTLVEIDSRKMQILNQNDGIISSVMQSVDAYERSVVESENSQDVPQMLAPGDKNPYIPEQKDQILGEQTIHGDEEPDETVYREIKKPAQKKPMDSYRIQSDSDQQKPVGTDRQPEKAKTVMVAAKTPAFDHKSKKSQFEEDEYEDDTPTDKFVYEDEVEDQSSEDPEQKFLKKHAQQTVTDNSDDYIVNQKAVRDQSPVNSLQRDIEKQMPRVSQSYLVESHRREGSELTESVSQTRFADPKEQKKN